VFGGLSDSYERARLGADGDGAYVGERVRAADDRQHEQHQPQDRQAANKPWRWRPLTDRPRVARRQAGGKAAADGARPREANLSTDVRVNCRVAGPTVSGSVGRSGT
jgi:hypothetical protein